MGSMLRQTFLRGLALAGLMLPGMTWGAHLLSVEVGGAALRVEQARCSAMPVNIRWPGHQRELDQTEIDGMVRCAASGPVRIDVTAPRDFKEVRVRPLARQIRPQIEGRVVTFELTRPGAYSVEFDGIHRNLHVFADPPAEYRVNKSADTIVFGPGEHARQSADSSNAMSSPRPLSSTAPSRRNASVLLRCVLTYRVTVPHFVHTCRHSTGRGSAIL